MHTAEVIVSDVDRKLVAVVAQTFAVCIGLPRKPLDLRTHTQIVPFDIFGAPDYVKYATEKETNISMTFESICSQTIVQHCQEYGAGCSISLTNVVQ